MLNQTVLVGRLVQDPKIYETESGTKLTSITLAVPRSYKNIDGEYDADFIPCVLWRGVAENTAEYCRKGDLIGIRGRIQTRKVELEEDKKREVTEVVAEKVTYLSSKRHDETDE